MKPTLIDRFPMAGEPQHPAMRLENIRGMPEWRDPLGREPKDCPGAVPNPAPGPSPKADGEAGDPAADPAADPATEAPAEPKPKAPVGVSWGDTLADIIDALFPKDPVKPTHRKLLAAKFKSEVDETQSGAAILAVIVGPKLWASDFGVAVRAWLWDHSVGLLKRWFRWPWWGGEDDSAESAAPAAAAAAKKQAAAAKDATIGVEFETTPTRPAGPAAVPGAAPAADTTDEPPRASAADIR